MTVTDEQAPALQTLEAIQDRVLWLASSIIHHANKVRQTSSGVKVGGHQASSASITSIMTALWFAHLRGPDRVSVKPHASPVLHAIEYLLGQLDARYLTTLREFGGLQSYPSRLKDPVPADFSTGSVGIGATAPIWSAVAHRYVAGHFEVPQGGREVALIGDAELDEGAIWETLVDPVVPHLGEVLWIVDLNRQSLDRVVPDIAAGRIARMFEAAGWQTITVKYGRWLRELFTRDGGEVLRARIDGMPNEEYQRLLRSGAAELRERLPGRGAGTREQSTRQTKDEGEYRGGDETVEPVHYAAVARDEAARILNAEAALHRRLARIPSLGDDRYDGCQQKDGHQALLRGGEGGQGHRRADAGSGDDPRERTRPGLGRRHPRPELRAADQTAAEIGEHIRRPDGGEQPEDRGDPERKREAQRDDGQQEQSGVDDPCPGPEAGSRPGDQRRREGRDGQDDDAFDERGPGKHRDDRHRRNTDRQAQVAAAAPDQALPFPDDRDSGCKPDDNENLAAPQRGGDRDGDEHESRRRANPEVAQAPGLRREVGLIRHAPANAPWRGAPSRSGPGRNGPGRGHAPEPAFACRELGERGGEGRAIEIRPQDRQEHELAVGGLPEQEIGQPLLARSADDQVGIRDAGRVEVRRDQRRVDLGVAQGAGGIGARDGRHGSRDLLSAAIVERHDERQALVQSGQGLGFFQQRRGCPAADCRDGRSP